MSGTPAAFFSGNQNPTNTLFGPCINTIINHFKTVTVQLLIGVPENCLISSVRMMYIMAISVSSTHKPFNRETSMHVVYHVIEVDRSKK